jgi:hypothetical protein
VRRCFEHSVFPRSIGHKKNVGTKKMLCRPVKPIVGEKGRLDVVIRSAGQRLLVLTCLGVHAQLAQLYDIHALSTQHALDSRG